MNFTNDEQRLEFLRNYWKWGLWKQDFDLSLRYYRTIFDNGAVLLVTEHQETPPWKDESVTAHRYHLILLHGDPYLASCSAAGNKRYKTYTLDGSGISVILDYMKKSKDYI